MVTVASPFTRLDHSLKKQKSKEERKLRRKQQRAATSITKNEMNNLKVEDTAGNETDKVIDQCKLT